MHEYKQNYYTILFINIYLISK